MANVAMRLHRGRRKFGRYPLVLDEMERVHNDRVKPEFVSAFDRIVANWTNKPSFRGRFVASVDGFRLYVYPVGSDEVKQIWWWNVQGTDPHPIQAKNAPHLSFNWGGKGSYMAKTGPGGTWFGGPGTVANGTFRGPVVIDHPGTAPREWPQVVANLHKRYYSRETENAWRRAVRKMDRG